MDIAAGLDPPLVPHTLSPVRTDGKCVAGEQNVVISDCTEPGLVPRNQLH